MEEKNIELNDEIKERLKKNGMLGFDVDSEFLYVPLFFRDAKNNIPKSYWPVFTLRSRTGIELAEAEDEAGYINIDTTGGRRYVTNSGTDRINALRKGLLAFRNLRLENDTIIEMKKGQDVEKFLRYIHPKLQVELKRAIDNHSTLNADELLGLE